MGTNYYWLRETKPACEHCGRPAEVDEIHIGKSSAGWCFSLHINDEIRSLADWEAKWASGGRIRDEYDRTISTADMRMCITERQGRGFEGFEFARNHAEPGPAGLVRHQIDPHCCVGHGEGTWDLITGEFS